MQPPSGLIAIGIDVGASATRVAAVDKQGRVLARRGRVMTPEDTAEQLIDWLTGTVAKVHGEACIQSDTTVPVGLALPGTLNRDRNAVVRSVNLPFLQHRPIVDELAYRIGRRPALFTDAEAATWAEYIVRMPRTDRFVHLRLGTGVACGVVIDGRLQRLDADRNAHLDILIVDDRPGAAPCHCGQRGCLETFCSGHALEKRATQLGYCEGITGLRQAWLRGDKNATQTIKEASKALAVAVANLTNQFQANVICIGGGVMTHLPELLEEVKEFCLEPARLGDDAGVIGAALLAWVPDPRARRNGR